MPPKYVSNSVIANFGQKHIDLTRFLHLVSNIVMLIIPDKVIPW